MSDPQTQVLEKKLDTLIDLTRHLVAIELASKSVTQEAIGKRLHVAKAAVVAMLSGVKKEKV